MDDEIKIRLDQMLLSGKVKKLITRRYKPLRENEIVAGELIETTTEFFNEQGILVQGMIIAKTDKSKDVYRYDAEKFQYDRRYYQMGELEEEMIVMFDAQGREQAKAYICPPVISKTIYEYGDDYLVEEYFVHSPEKISGKKEQMLLPEEFNLETVTISRYDKDGLVAEKRLFDDEDILCDVETFKYDNRGNMIRRISINQENDNREETYQKFSDADRLIEDKTIFNGRLEFQANYEHDVNGNVIQEIVFFPDENIITIDTFRFEYDKHNNWISKVIVKDGITLGVIEREIEYYE